MNPNILVTGGCGFIGQRLVDTLIKNGHQVAVFDMPNAPFPAHWQGKVKKISGDIRSREHVWAALDGMRTVYHLAAIATDAGTLSHHRSVTVGGTRNVMEAAAQEKARVVLTSSITVYGEKLQSEVLDESLPHGKPAGIYGTCKQEQETLARKLAAENGTELVVLRVGNVYGRKSNLWVDGVITELRRGTPSLIGGGDFDAGLCHVSNLVDALMLAAATPAAAGGVYNVADGFGITWKQYFSDLAALANAPKPRALPRAAAKILSRVVESFWRGIRLPGRPPLTYEAYNLVGHPLRFPIQRIQRELGYQPGTSYAQALDEIRAYLQEK
jgi:nucleoside-diphosphate-sugar epimerase